MCVDEEALSRLRLLCEGLNHSAESERKGLPPCPLEIKAAVISLQNSE